MLRVADGGVARVLSGTEHDALTRIAQRGWPDPVQDPHGFWLAARRGADTVPASLAPSDPAGLVLLRGLPADHDLPGTPSDSRRPPGSHSFLSELWLSVFGLLLGVPIAFPDQQGAALHQNVAPIPGSEHEESDVGSSRPLRLHTENPFHAIAPDHVLLCCLRGDLRATVATTLAPVSAVVAQLDTDARDRLRRPIFFERGTEGTRLAPVLGGPAHEPMFRFDAAWTTSATADGIAALHALASALPSVTQSVNLVPGDLLVIDNRRWLHGRGAFTAHPGSTGRWLQRLYVCEQSALVDDAVERGLLVRATVAPLR